MQGHSLSGRVRRQTRLSVCPLRALAPAHVKLTERTTVLVVSLTVLAKAEGWVCGRRLQGGTVRLHGLGFSPLPSSVDWPQPPDCV